MNSGTTEAEGANQRKLRVLVAEDSPVNQRVAVRQLEQLGHAAEAVGNGARAIEAWERVAYDIILMDCNMPEMDGYEATWQIRDREKERATGTGSRPPTYIIAMTATSEADSRERCLAAGMDDYISKPVQLPELAAALDRATQEGGAAKAIAEVIDPVVIAGLRQLREPGKPELLVELIDLFLTDAPARLGAIEEAIVRNDIWSMSRAINAATSLKGSASNLGARHLAALCDDIEKEAHRGTPADARPLLVLAKDEFTRVRAALEKIKSPPQSESDAISSPS